MKVVLASKSLRRKKVLEENGYIVEVDVSNFDEESIKNPDVKELTMDLARLKAETVADRHPKSIIIAADTLVYFEGEQIGQQHSIEDAERTIRKLMGGKTRSV